MDPQEIMVPIPVEGGSSVAENLHSLLTAAKSAEAAERLRAAKTLEQVLLDELERGQTAWEPLAKELIPVLIGCLGDPEKGVQVHAANCLEFLSYQSAAVLPALRAAVGGAFRPQAWTAALVAARLDLWAPEMGDALREALGAPDRDLRWAAAHAIRQLSRTHPEAAAVVVGTLSDPNPIARRMAAYCLGALGKDGAGEAPLEPLLADADPTVRRAALLALARLPALSQEMLTQVAALQADPDPFVRRTAAAVADRNRCSGTAR